MTAMNSENPGMAIGMMERALKDEVKAMFLVYATHVDLPDQENLIRPGADQNFQRGPGNLSSCAQQFIRGCHLPRGNLG